MKASSRGASQMCYHSRRPGSSSHCSKIPRFAMVRALAYRISLPLAGAALLLGVFGYYELVAYKDYLLRGDDPAFVSAALESPASWFTRGYLNYFLIYPEWVSHHTSPLLKPVTNAVAYLNNAVFGTAYALHFAIYF